MKTVAVLSAAALIGVGVLASSAAEARGGGALAAGIIGGLAAGALLGAAVSDAHAGPDYGYARPGPADGFGPAPVAFYRPAPIVRGYAYEEPAYQSFPVEYGYRREPHRWHRDWDRPYAYRGW
ncbi:hypothetical protein [Methylobacterium brachythecii]|uniref:PXPV repeat-containing protein n=1 Tax=Methylobacterium brachythecii TaxID=1176177 RepID=A0A7W6F6U0_9HYPH|nr:hypothetical protein [Methylobacterium brachythecii]MBB3902797.1 hypothetical protein [Methylobacterium brachythecii]GLS43722.1 hypothetical protein GCM10007884_17070 [Methylobacterium brachythecii]